MYDDMLGITFVYFEKGTVQIFSGELDHDPEFEEFCIHMDANDHQKLINALNTEKPQIPKCINCECNNVEISKLATTHFRTTFKCLNCGCEFDTPEEYK